VATGPHCSGVTRIRHLPWSTIACRYSPVGVFAGDGPVVVDQRLNGVRQVDHLGVTVDLHVGVIEFVGQHHDAGKRGSTDIGRFARCG
jgi:hypothetical protein